MPEGEAGFFDGNQRHGGECQVSRAGNCSMRRRSTDAIDLSRPMLGRFQPLGAITSGGPSVKLIPKALLEFAR